MTKAPTPPPNQNPVSHGGETSPGVVSRRELLRRGLILGGALVVAQAALPDELLSRAEAAKKRDRYKYLGKYNPEKDKTAGNIRIARILPKEKYMTLKRRDGTKINVPFLRDNEDPSLIAESALALWAAYFTTGNKKPLKAFSPDSDVKSVLSERRDSDNVPANLSSSNGGAYSQLLIYDQPADPAVFERSLDAQGRDVVSLTSGTLFYKWQHGGDAYESGWQHPDLRSDPAQLYFTELAFSLETSMAGKVELNGVQYNLLNLPEHQ